jgi:hypothetical protein
MLNDILNYLIPISLANMLTEQTIGRSLSAFLFPHEHYLTRKGLRKAMASLMTCWTCSTFWVTIIYMVAKHQDFQLQYINIALINALITDIILKFKK